MSNDDRVDELLVKLLDADEASARSLLAEARTKETLLVKERDLAVAKAEGAVRGPGLFGGDAESSAALQAVATRAMAELQAASVPLSDARAAIQGYLEDLRSVEQLRTTMQANRIARSNVFLTQVMVLATVVLTIATVVALFK